MSCPKFEVCGGCRYRDMSYEQYCQLKRQHFIDTLSPVISSSCKINQPLFIPDNTRRRASLAFEASKNGLILGFNSQASHQIIDIQNCLLLTPKLNKVLPFIKGLLEEICQTPYNIKKGKKHISSRITKGDVFICEACNGIDVVLEYNAPLSLEHRMIIFEKSQADNDIIRISHRKDAFSSAETIIEKIAPFIKIGNYEVTIPAGTFLQPSAPGQEALTWLVMKYMQSVQGKIADLFCGVGTFSYFLCDLPDVKITAVDSSAALLKGFNASINRNQIKNIQIINKNLFKYPLDKNELKDFSAIVFDPPRAGASAQCKEIALCPSGPKIIVAVSCNPATFINDAKSLISGGYNLKEVTMVDQFIYSDHSELVAFFTK